MDRLDRLGTPLNGDSFLTVRNRVSVEGCNDMSFETRQSQMMRRRSAWGIYQILYECRESVQSVHRRVDAGDLAGCLGPNCGPIVPQVRLTVPPKRPLRIDVRQAGRHPCAGREGCSVTQIYEKPCNSEPYQPMMTPSHFCDLLQISRPTLCARLRSGMIPCEYVGGLIRLEPCHVQRWSKAGQCCRILRESRLRRPKVLPADLECIHG